MTSRFPAEDVAKAIKVLPAISKKRDYRIVASWFLPIPVEERAEYRALVESYLVAEHEFELLDRILSDFRMAGFGPVKTHFFPQFELGGPVMDIRVSRVIYDFWRTWDENEYQRREDEYYARKHLANKIIAIRKRLALAMALHSRLGEVSPLAVLPADLMKTVLRRV